MQRPGPAASVHDAGVRQVKFGKLAIAVLQIEFDRAEGYAILTDDVESVTGRLPLSIHDFAREHGEFFTA